MDAEQKIKLHTTAISFLKLDGKPPSLSDSHIRESFKRYTQYCAAQQKEHLPEIWFKRVVRAHYYPEQVPKNLPPMTPQDIWNFASKTES